MSVPPDSSASVAAARNDVWLLGLSCLGPVLWFSALTLLYALTAECHVGAHVWTWLVLGVCSAGSVASLLALSRSAHKSQPEYARFLLQSGLTLVAFSLVLLVGLAVPLLEINACE